MNSIECDSKFMDYINIYQPEVCIMMATYNGEKYLKQQIDSILRQTYTNWHMIIQDDGSTDSTYSILKKYAENDKRISIMRHLGKNHGAYYNFHSLANECKKQKKYDYYMFCDQDDIWYEDKIKKLLNLMILQDNSNPLLAYADMRVVNEKNVTVLNSINSTLGMDYINKYSTFFSHNIYGCNIILNQKLFFTVPFIDTEEDTTRYLSHDNLYAKFAAITGNIVYFPEILMDYRRHGENVTSKQNYNFTFKRIICRLFKIEDLAKDHALTYRQSMVAVQLLKELNIKDKFLDDFERAILYGGLYSLYIVKKYKISWGKKIKNVSRCLVLLSKRYKKYI